MIIGFAAYGKGAGGAGPALNYLTGYLVNGERRASKPEVIRGDPAAVAQIIDTLPFKCRYSSGVLSFAAEDRVTPEIQEDVMNRFENAVFAGLAPDRRGIVWIKHTDKGRVELHVVMVRGILGTPTKAWNPAPPTPASRQLFDTLRESINLRYGFRDPSAAACKQPVSVPAHIAKLAAQAKRLGRSTKPDIRKVITERLADQVRTGLITTRADVVNCLRAQGFTLSREGMNFLTVVCPGTGEHVRLKGEIYRRNFRPEDLRPETTRHDPARLFTLDRSLARLVEKRAAYHRARYELSDPTPQPVQSMEGLVNDRTRITIAPSRATHGPGLSATRPAVCRDALRVNEASQHLGHASDRLEQSRQRLVQAHSSLTRDFDAAVNETSRRKRTSDLFSRYAVASQDASQERGGISLELEL